jgi:hypothetical protein
MNLRTDEDKQSADLSRREFVTKVAMTIVQDAI